jgi:hypothetical protein
MIVTTTRVERGGAALAWIRRQPLERSSGPHPRRDAKNMGQPVDRDHDHVILDALEVTRTDETQDSKRAAACPPSPAP